MRRYLALGAVALAVLPGAAHAQTKLEARYAVTLAGIPLGAGTWVIDIAADQYTAVASGRTTGLVKLISDGSGTTGSKGTLQGANVISYRLHRQHDLGQEGRRSAHDDGRRRRQDVCRGPAARTLSGARAAHRSAPQGRESIR